MSINIFPKGVLRIVLVLQDNLHLLCPGLGPQVCSSTDNHHACHNYGNYQDQIFRFYLVTAMIIKRMDWGFFAANAGENTLLREETVYPRSIILVILIILIINLNKENYELLHHHDL